MVVENRREGGHLGRFGPIEPLIFNKVRKELASVNAVPEALDRGAVGVDHLMRAEVKVIVLQDGRIGRNVVHDADAVDEILCRNQSLIEIDAV